MKTFFGWALIAFALLLLLAGGTVSVLICGLLGVQLLRSRTASGIPASGPTVEAPPSYLAASPAHHPALPTTPDRRTPQRVRPTVLETTTADVLADLDRVLGTPPQ